MKNKSNNPFDVKIKKVKASGVIVDCMDGSEGWLPADEWSYDWKEWERDRPRLKAGKVERAILWGRTFNDDRRALSRRRVAYNPWGNVTEEWIGRTMQFVVIRLTKQYAIGEVEPGLQAKIEFKAFDDYIKQRDSSKFWRIHSRIALNDCVAGIVTEIHWPDTCNEPIIVLDPAELFNKIETDPAFLVNQAKLVSITNQNVFPSDFEIHDRAPNIKNIFMLDNDTNFLNLVAEVLESSGYHVTKASSEDEAFDKLQSLKDVSIDLALIDLHLLDDMSAHDGLNVAKQIAETMPYCKIVLMSGEDIGLEYKDKIQKKINDGKDMMFAAYVQKPLTINQLHYEIARAAAGQIKDIETIIDELIGISDTNTPHSDSDKLNKKRSSDNESYSIENAVNELGGHLPGVVVHVFQMHPESYFAKSMAHYGEGLHWEKVRHKLLKSPVRDTAVDSKRDFWIYDDVNSYNHMRGKHYWLLQAMNYRSALGIPINALSEYGYCLLAFHREPNKFTEEFVTRAYLCVERVGRALEWDWFTKKTEERARFETAGMSFVRLSHEVRNDLFSLAAQAKLLEDSLQGNLNEDAFRKLVTEKVIFLKSGIDRAIMISQTLGGIKTSKDTQSLKIIECLDEAIKAVRTQIPNGKTIDLKRVECNMEYIVCGTWARLVPALFNLLLNAVQQINLFIRPKGLIWVDFKEQNDGNGNWLQININDTGPGIHAAYFRKVFDIGYSTKPEGTGMGLHICRQDISSIHDGERSGRVDITRSTLCIGTTFSVYLPVISSIRKEN